MVVEVEISKMITQLAIKVLTPIMVLILLIFSGTGYAIFKAQSIDPTFNFSGAFWTWLIVCLAFTPLCGAILWVQSVKVINGKRKKRTSTPRKSVPKNVDVNV